MIKKLLKQQLINLCLRLGENKPLLIDWGGLSGSENAANLLDSMRYSKLLIPQEREVPFKKNIVIFAPHPDDEVIGMGGTLKKMIDNDCTVDVIYFTLKDNEELVVEAEKAANLLGYNTHHLGFERRNIDLKSPAFEDLVSLLKTLKPDIICLPFMLDDHEDHHRMSDILAALNERSLFTEIMVSEIWAYQVYTALPLNTAIDITDVLEDKLEAIRCYQSCFKSRDWAHFAKGLNAFNVRFLPGCNQERYAEVFVCTPPAHYLEMHKTYKAK